MELRVLQRELRKWSHEPVTNCRRVFGKRLNSVFYILQNALWDCMVEEAGAGDVTWPQTPRPVCCTCTCMWQHKTLSILLRILLRHDSTPLKVTSHDRTAVMLTCLE